jgi:hypothetical protein
MMTNPVPVRVQVHGRNYATEHQKYHQPSARTNPDDFDLPARRNIDAPATSSPSARTLDASEPRSSEWLSEVHRPRTIPIEGRTDAP